MTLQRAYERLRLASARLESVRRPGWDEVASRLDVSLQADSLHVFWLLNEDALFQPESGEYIFTEIYRTLGSTQVAPWIASLTLEGHQIACNGTIPWELKPIAYARSRFSRLKVFRVGAVDVGDGPCYAGSLAGEDWNDTTVASRLLDRMPVLAELSLPEPPREEMFFHGKRHPLRKLTVFGADFDSCVPRLAASRRFPQLTELRLVESECERLPASTYARLLTSEAFPALRAVTLGQVKLPSELLPFLRGSKVGRQLCRFTVQPEWIERQRVALHEWDEKFAPCPTPFLPPALDHAWLTGTVTSLAQGMLESGDLSAMPILADALEDAGCSNREVLDHCRSPGLHLAGCWILDLLLHSGNGRRLPGCDVGVLE
jgi:hypothetical protein